MRVKVLENPTVYEIEDVCSEMALDGYVIYKTVKSNSLVFLYFECEKS